MNFKLFLSGFTFFILGQAVAWFQVYGPLIWPKVKEYTWTVYLLSPIIAFCYIKATEHTVSAFDGVMWPSRLIGFTAGITVFTVATLIFKGEGINLKTGVTLALCAIILAIQILWKN